MVKSERITTTIIKQMKAEAVKVVGLTAWDFLSGRFADEAGADIILVGDSLSMTIRGDKNTLSITLDDMIYHSRMVSKAVNRALVVGDMPFMSYQVSPNQAVISAGRFVKEGGVQAVKIEGGEIMGETVARVVSAGIPVMGHIGLTPQSIHQVGGLKVQGKEIKEARKIITDAQILENAGAFAIVLECLPAELAAEVTEKITIPTIGIGAGLSCDGQIQVTADVLGMLSDVAPRHAKKYVDLAGIIAKALTSYISEVREAKFPTEKNSFFASDDLRRALKKEKT